MKRKRKKSSTVEQTITGKSTTECVEKAEHKTKIRKSKFPAYITIIICICMVLIVVIQFLSIAYVTREYLSNKADSTIIMQACQEIYAGNFITLGLSIIAIAVSVWIGLNINVAIEKGELSDRIEELSEAHEDYKNRYEKNLVDFQERQSEVEKTFKKQYEENWEQLNKRYVDNLKKEWIDKIISLSDQYILSEYLGAILSMVDFGGDIELITTLLRYESDYIVLTQLYEAAKWDKCKEKAEQMLSMDFSDRNVDERLRTYIEVRISDVKFYKSAGDIRTGKTDESVLRTLEQSLKIYHKLEQSGNIAQYSRWLEVYAYICNTLGYSYDLMNQVDTKSEERKKIAIEYMRKAVESSKECKGTITGRYYRNLGLTYQKAKQWAEARDAYKKAFENNPEDYKSCVTLAGIILDDIDRELEIKFRKKPLCDMGEEFVPYEKEIKYAIELCETSICISPIFEDSYYKIAQAYTYLYLLTGKQKEYIEAARKNLRKLEIRGFKRAGYKFVLRNMYEALGDKQKAVEINSTIGSTSGNDVERISELYKEWLGSEDDVDNESDEPRD